MKKNLFSALMGAAAVFAVLAPAFAISCTRERASERETRVGDYTEIASKNIKVVELYNGTCVAIVSMDGVNSAVVAIAMTSVPCEAK